jgi:copper homeostasis protein
MIRPRSGLFCFSDTETGIMLADINAAQEAGLAGVVIGVQSPDGTLDAPLLRKLVSQAGRLGTTLHRVIDVVPDPLAALDTAIELGIERVLTSGAQPFAPEGVPLIRQMIEKANGQISVMPGCGLTPENVGEVIAATGAREIHAACLIPAEGVPAFSDFDPPAGRFITSRAEVERMISGMDRDPRRS